MARNRDQRFPPVPKGKVLELEASIKKRQEDNERVFVRYFDQMQYQRGRREDARMKVILAAIRHEGLPSDEDEILSFLLRCHRLADAHILPEMRDDALKVKEIVEALKIKTLPPHLVWSCEQMGVTLFEGEPETLPGELPKSEPPPEEKTEHQPIITDPRG